MNEAVIVSAVRLPVGRVGGALSAIRPERLGGMVIREALKRGNVPDDMVDEVVFCSCDNEDLKVSGRVISLAAGLPIDVPAYQIQRGCSSSLTAVWDAVMMIRCGFKKCVVCGGAESTSFAPYLMNKPTRAYSQAPMSWAQPVFSPEEYGNLSNGQTADEIARVYNISREDCDRYSVWSHRKASNAYKNHWFDSQLLPVEVKTKTGTRIFDRDEPLRDDCKLEDLARLKPSFAKDGTCTAGNSSPLSDGASCVIVMDKEYAIENGMNIMATVTDFADVGVNPRMMGEGPIYACKKLLAQNNYTWDDIDLIEMNEAFAPQCIRCIQGADMPIDKVNVNGGVIALGHPFAATGTILLTRLIYELQRRGEHRGIVTFCVGGGLGVALMAETP